MVDAEVLTAKLAELSDRVDRVRSHCPPDAPSLARDRDALDLVSFNLMLAVQVCLDVASHVIADEGWPPATDLAGSFRRLAQHGVIGDETADALARASGLRNVVAHVYASVDPVLLFTAASSGVEDLERFAREVARWTRAQLDPGSG